LALEESAGAEANTIQFLLKQQGNSILRLAYSADDAIQSQLEVMENRMVQLSVFIIWCASWTLTSAYPIESKPLNNNPDTWNFDGWLYFNPRNSADPSALALIGGDPHVKKSKITPKSIFIAPSAYTGNEQLCPHGFRVDDNGKCIKTVTIPNQDEILAARISELFGIDESPNKNSDIDSDYYDFDDESKSEKDSGPLQINLPLALDTDDDDDDSKKVEYVVERFSVRNLDPKLVRTTTERFEETTAPATETTTETVATEEPSTSSTPSPTEAEDESSATVTESQLPISSTVKDDDGDEIALSTLPPTTVEPITLQSTTTTPEPSTTTSTSTSTTTTSTVAPVKIFSVDFLPKSQRKSNRMGQASARLKNSRDRNKTEHPRKQKTTVASVSSSEVMTKLLKLDKEQIAKKNRTRAKRRKLTTTTTELITKSPVTTTQKPFWWLPKGWSIDESKEKPVLVRFWAQQPLKQDERARSHNASRQRVNSRMPSDNIFREVSVPEFESLMQK
jgi:Folded gastrulation N-terminus